MLDNLRQKIQGLRIVKSSDEKLLDSLVALNKDLTDEEGALIQFNSERAIKGMQNIRAILSGYGMSGDVGSVFSAAVAYDMEKVQAAAQTQYKEQVKYYKQGVNQTILAAMRLAESTLEMEGDLFSGIVSPIELSLTARVWVTAHDKALMKDLNDLLRAWNVVRTICNAWQDMEYYSAFYVSHAWKDGVPVPIHWSPKRVAVGNVGGFYSQTFSYLPANRKKITGDEAQTALEFFETVTGKSWNDWPQGQGGAKLKPEFLTWEHFMKPRHKVYPYPWVAKGATPAYTRQIIEEMRLALVQGVMNQLWVLTVEDPQPREISKLKTVIGGNRAERIGFLIWRAGLKVDIYSPNTIEQLLLPDAWWAATLDMFRRVGRPVRIVAGENPQRSGQSSSDAEIDVRILQNKAMGHRQIVAEKIVLDLIRQWANQNNKAAVIDALNKGKIMVHMTPIQLFLGEDLQKIWGPMWDKGMTSIRTIHAALGIDTDFEAEMLEQEKTDGYDETFVARQQFAQRVATPQGEVTKSPFGGRPPGSEEIKAAMEDISPRILSSFEEIDKSEDPEERKRRVTAFIALLTALIGAHMRSAYREGYAAAGGWQTVSEDKMKKAILWEQGYIDNFETALLQHVEFGESAETERYRAELHPKSSWKRAYMDGVFQAKEEAGWRFWQRVLRPGASKSGPCEVCTRDSKVWHPISEPFWDHPYGVCSLQMVRFMQSGLDGWEAISAENVEVPLVY